MERIGPQTPNPIPADGKREVQGISIMQRFMNLFKKKKPEIFHLGGTHVASHDLTGKHKILHKGYFFEKIAIKTKNGEIFIYGNLLKPHAEEWMTKTRNGETNKTFQDFMQEKFASDVKLENSLIQQSVRYFNDTDRKQTKVRVFNGKLVQTGLDSDNKTLKPMAPGEYIFVIADTMIDGNIQRSLYATPKGKTKAGKTQHSSFVRAGNVLSAGKMSIDDKGFITISNSSGHYRPQAKEIMAALKYFQEAGFELSKINVLCYHSDLSAGLDHQFNVKWGVTSQRADLWLEQVEKKS